ncbi:MAG: heme ABC exporter ATP-binding protein CcmA [Rhodospirillales bacterium]|nr:heme ABC exporter ATP-binding protein CcmA [Rhodospirillales bacterium]
MTRFTGDDVACVRGERTVFFGLSFQLGAGELLLLTGPNGSGKSTLLRLMAGLSRPIGGRIQWDGEDIAAEPERHRSRLQYVGHADAVKPQLSVKENLGFWASLARDGVSPGAAIEDALAAFGMEALRDMPSRFLSAGQRRRLALARILVAPAALWLLDEPAASLDDAAVQALDHALQSHGANGGIAVVSTHIGLAGETATRARVLDLTPARARPVVGTLA